MKPCAFGPYDIHILDRIIEGSSHEPIHFCLLANMVKGLHARMERLEGMEKQAQDAADGVRRDELDELRASMKEFVRWVGSAPDAQMIGEQRCNILDKLRELGLITEETP